MTETRTIWCCGCEAETAARLTDGKEIYPHRTDLRTLPFWRCDTCQNFVGCHHKTAERTRPLGCIPTKAIKDARQHIHRVLDPIWQSKRMARGKVYSMIAERLNKPEYHTAEIRSVDEARLVYRIVTEIAGEAA